jgi:hypothetical protein
MYFLIAVFKPSNYVNHTMIYIILKLWDIQIAEFLIFFYYWILHLAVRYEMKKLLHNDTLIWLGHTKLCRASCTGHTGQVNMAHSVLFGRVLRFNFGVKTFQLYWYVGWGQVVPQCVHYFKHKAHNYISSHEIKQSHRWKQPRQLKMFYYYYQMVV